MDGSAWDCRVCGSRLSDGDRFCSSCGAVAAVAEAGPEARKNVVVLFVDLVRSTALGERLDPELLHGVLRRYYGVCSDLITEHGGVVEKYIGDAIMAVFGVPVAREDDALRAARAALALVEAVHRLSAELGPIEADLEVHCGIGSGEVVVITTPGAQLRIVGDTVNTAARLQSAAGPGETLLNGEAAQLVRGRVGLEELRPLALRGKALPERAWRVTSAVAAPAGARTAMVGRSAELDGLLERYLRVVAEGFCGCVLVHGEAGIGKTRLVLEFTARPELAGALVLTGCCQPYGKDITFHPLASMLRDSLPGGWVGLERLLGSGEQGERARRTLSAVAGSPEQAGGVPAGAEEICWAATRLFTGIARSRPLVLVWEDLQWAEGALLGLLDELTRRLSGVPVLVVCVARNELLEKRQDAGVPGAERIGLGPLGPADTLGLVETLTSGAAEVAGQGQDAVTARIVELSAGNPLFVTAMIDALADDGSPPAAPPTISAMLRARIDALPPAERRALQWAAACGSDFADDELLVLAEQDGTASAHVRVALAGLRRRGLIQPLGAGRMRCGQSLVRDTCYAMTAKSSRARWHALLAERAPSPAESMFHAERATQLFREVGPDEPRLPVLAGLAVRLLAEEGTTALHRRDAVAAGSLFQRALELHAERGRHYADLTVRLSEARLALGDGGGALEVLEAGLEGAAADGRVVLRLQRDIVRFRLGRLGFEAARAAIAAHERRLDPSAVDELGRCLMHQFKAFVALGEDQVGRAEAEFHAALERARRLEERWIEHRLSNALCELAQWSPATVSEGLRLCGELLRGFEADRLLLIPVMAARARLLALAGRVDEARAALSAARQDAASLRAAFPEIAINQSEAVLLSLVGEHAPAARRFGEAAAMLREQGHLQPALTLEVYAVRELLRCGRYGTARAAFDALEAGEHTIGMVARARIWLELVRARFACAEGRPAEGFELAARTLDGISTDDPCLLGDAWFEFAAISRMAGRPYRVAIDAAEAHYLAKGATLPAGTVRRWAAGDGGGR
ncbi:adenylate/guanylate cyclase domain-containing protein [Nonomuraea sediminis]|uniref:adenylate/guanylate cyclase domain-containing protein n=1 Tax=Nonomuraea sediminis TaxID=2835864 RepID=UPI001BDC6544|nr:adenylate/guanylate cyclase domain-containing protein [Nonomuraea sediminis]